MDDDYKPELQLKQHDFHFKDDIFDSDDEERQIVNQATNDEIIDLFYSIFNNDIDYKEKKAIADKIAAFIFVYPQYYGEIQREHLNFILDNLNTPIFIENSLRSLSKILQTLNSEEAASNFYDQIMGSSIFENFESLLSNYNDNITVMRYTFSCILILVGHNDSHILTRLYESNVFERLGEFDIRSDYYIGLLFLKLMELMIIFDYSYDDEKYDNEYMQEICLDKGYDAIQTGENNFISSGLSIIINGFRAAPMFPYIYNHTEILKKIIDIQYLKIPELITKIIEFFKCFLEMGEEAFNLASPLEVIPFIMDVLNTGSDEELDYLLDLILIVLNSGEEIPICNLMEDLIEQNFAEIFGCMSWETKTKFLSVFPRILSFVDILHINQVMSEELISFFGDFANSGSILISSDAARLLTEVIDKSGRDPNLVQTMTNILANEGCLDALEDISFSHHDDPKYHEHVEIIDHFLEYHRAVDTDM